MGQLKIFENEEFGQIRTVTRDGEVWFVGKDVAEALGFTNSRDAIATHVFDDDKGVEIIDTLGGKQKMTAINESGLYALVFGSRLESAKRFKRWVTYEVLPAKKSEKRTEKRVPKIMENVVEIGESVPKIMEDVTEIEKDVPEISENVIEKEAKVTHQIKLVAEFFDDAATGRKSFELRKNDRNYKEGDVLEMEEVKDGKKTGRKCSKRIVYMMENFEGLEDGYCILGCELL